MVYEQHSLTFDRPSPRLSDYPMAGLSDDEVSGLEERLANML